MNAVSFVVTVYNKAAALPGVIRSLGAQDGDYDREFIFVDDCSTDDSVALIRELTNGWQAVRIVENTVNRGPAVRLNQAVRLARHPVIKTVDGDDLLFQNGTQLLLDLLQRHEADAVFAAPSAVYADPADGMCRIPPLSDSQVEISRSPLETALTQRLYAASNFLGRRDTILKSGGSDERIFVQDVSLAYRVAAVSSCIVLVGHPVSLMPEALPGRLSSNHAQEHHDGSLAALHILQEVPDMDRRLVRMILKKQTGRARRLARRLDGKTLSSPYFWLYLSSYLPTLAWAEERVAIACRALRRGGNVRLPDGVDA